MAEQPALLRIIEEDRNVLHAVIQTTEDLVTIMANVVRQPTRLVLDKVHVEGGGLTRAIIRKAATELGSMKGVDEVLLLGGVRTSGANPGHVPKPILVRVGT